MSRKRTKEYKSEKGRKVAEKLKARYASMSAEERKELTKQMHTEESRKNISKACKGRGVWNKGKNKENDERVANNSKNVSKGLKRYHKNMTDDERKKYCEKMSNQTKKFWDNIDCEQKEKRLENSFGKTKYKNTKIELKVKEQLDYYNIKYIMSLYKVDRKNKIRFIFDFYLPDYRLVIECNGEYWHGPKHPEKQKRDKLKEEFVKRVNRDILWLWERDIVKKDFDIADYIDV